MPVTFRPPSRPLLRRLAAAAVILAAVGAHAPSARSQAAHCEPGAATLTASSQLVLSGGPIAASVSKRDDMYYIRGEYSVLETVHGELETSEIVVEHSCIDMPRGPSDPPVERGGPCPDGQGLKLEGFDADAEGKLVARSAPVVLFLSAASESPLDGAEVYSDVRSRPFTSCIDAPAGHDAEALLEAVRRLPPPGEDAPAAAELMAQVEAKRATQQTPPPPSAKPGLFGCSTTIY